MTDLQQFDFRQSAYERPNQRWRCGWAAEGQACQIGPDGKGNCRATFECQPVMSSGRWQCTRSELAGGRCEDGPLPGGSCCRAVPRCRPVRTWRARIRLTAQWVTAATVGLLLLLMAGDGGPAFIDPGHLTFQHSEIEGCAGCHTAFDKGPTAWVQAAFSTTSEIQDAEKCLACHDLGEQAILPHSQSITRLLAVTKRTGPPTSPGMPIFLRLANAVGDSHRHERGEVPCLHCHQEHHGQEFDLTATENGRCMVCHKAKFASLADGHPEFSSYPYDRRTRLAFDHVSHLGKHFVDDKIKALAPKQCKNCHTPDTKGGTMLVKGYETVCSACHGGQIEGEGRSGSKGIAFFTVPGLDVEILRELNVAIGSWPEDAEDEVTPFTDFLLSGDEDYLAARAVIADVDLMDLADAEDEVMDAVKTVAWKFKAMLRDLLVDGADGLKKRLETRFGRELTNNEVSRLTAALPVDALRSAQRNWFPKLLEEMERRDDGKEVEIPEEEEEKDEEEEAKPGEEWATAGGWYREDFSLVYRPTGHADPFIRSWLDVAGEGAVGHSKPSADEIFDVLANPKSPGVCGKCHSVDDTGIQGLRVNWFAKQPVPGQQNFTRYSHTAHFPLLDERGCLTCHELNDKADFAAGFKDANPHTFSSNFNPILRKVCAECHTKQVAGDSCVRCHNYHVGTFPPAVASTPTVMRKALAPAAK